MSDTAFFITYAGVDAANGPYTPTGKMRYGAPVYENDRKCLLSREPHMNSATRQTSHGWIIGQGGKPLYGVQTESLAPPSSGWMKFGGAFPLPRLEPVAASEATLVAAEQLKEQGKEFFVEKRFDVAEAKWSRALALPDLPDKELLTALFFNRSEARIRQYEWYGALADAKEAVDFVQQCIDAHPSHPDAKNLLMEVEKLLDAENETMTNNTLKVAKVQDEWFSKQGAPEGEQGVMPKAFAAKDTNSKKGYDAFAGYGKGRSGDADEAPVPVASLPYHQMGLPADKVEAMDKSVQAIREKRVEAKQKAKEAAELYPRIKEDYKERAAENLKLNKNEPIERIMPSSAKVQSQSEDASALEAKVLMQALQASSGEGQALSKVDTDAIDSLFAGFGEQRPALEVVKKPTGGKAAKLKAAKAKLTSGAR